MRERCSRRPAVGTPKRNHSLSPLAMCGQEKPGANLDALLAWCPGVQVLRDAHAARRNS